jgi:4-amino-4-deoxy-L-arabinose transferase-like glycosyltransferase
MAMNFAERGEQVVQVAPDRFVSGAVITAGFPLIYPVSLSYTLFGAGVLQGRAIMVLFLCAFVLAAYVFARRMFGVWHASWAVLVLASFPMLYGNGKSVLGEIPGLLFLVLFLIAIDMLEKRSFRDVRLFALAGLAAGLCVVTKPIFLLLAPAVFVVWIMRFRRIPLSWKTVGAGALAFFVPVAIWVMLQFGSDDSLHDVLAFYANPYETPELLPLVLKNLARFVTELTPAYTLGAFLVWGVSFFARRAGRISVSTAELIAFFFSLIVLFAFIRLPGWYRYLFPAVVPALIALPFAATSVYHMLGEKLIPLLLRFRWFPYAALIVLICAQLYQVGFASYVADYYGSHRTEEATALLASLPLSESVFFYNVPELVILLPHRDYYQFIAPHPQGLIGEEQLPLLSAGTPDVVLATRSGFEAAPEKFSHYADTGVPGRYVLLRRR